MCNYTYNSTYINCNYIGNKNIKPFVIAKVGKFHSKTSTSNSEFKFSHSFLDLGGGFAFFAMKITTSCYLKRYLTKKIYIFFYFIFDFYIF